MILNSVPGNQSNQLSYIGGKPRLPIPQSIPCCLLCGSQQTFFFQIAFPKGELWSGLTLAFYNCTNCVDEHYLIPQMLNTELFNVNIPNEFLGNYQKNFYFVIFPTMQGQIVSTYKEAIVFSEIQFSENKGSNPFGKLGDSPTWILEDESPATYAKDIPMKFLFEIFPKFQFRINKQATPQMELDIVGNPAPFPFNYYQLFLGNAIYLFGTTKDKPLVYVITQV